MSKKERSPLIKHRSITKRDLKTDKLYTLSIVVRENGRFEVYSDFTLVYDSERKEEQCVDVDTDYHLFYLRFVEKSDKITRDS